jgi:hypothetical protein
MSTFPNKTVTRRVAAEMIGIAPATLKKWSIEGRGPVVHAKIGASKQARTLYSLVEIERWRSDPTGYRPQPSSPRRRQKNEGHR